MLPTFVTIVVSFTVPQWKNKDTYEEICEKLPRRTLYEDTDYAPENIEMPDIDHASCIYWEYPHLVDKDAIFVSKNSRQSTPVQGEIGTCWLLAEVKNLINDRKQFRFVVPKSQRFHSGLVHFRFFVGEWFDINIDTRLPYCDRHLCFAKSSKPTEYWIPLIEKAVGKFLGSYHSLDGGLTTTAQLILFGAISETVKVDEQVFDKVTRRMNAGCHTIATTKGEDDDNIINGVVCNHAYNLVSVEEINVNKYNIFREEKIVALSNPWGENIGVRKYGVRSGTQYNYMSCKVERKMKKIMKSNKDILYVTELDFLRLFDNVDLVHTARVLSKRKATVYYTKGSINARSGPRSNLDSFLFNNQYVLRINNNDLGKTIIFSLIQTDLEKLNKIGISIYDLEDEDEINHKFQANFFTSRKAISKISEREIEVKLSMEAKIRKFLIIPFAGEYNVSAKYILRVFVLPEQVDEESEDDDDEEEDETPTKRVKKGSRCNTGIPVSQQHLIYNMQELDDSSCLIDYSIPHGATLKLVLSMRGGPISTRRLPLIDDLAWRKLKDLVEGSREEMLDLPAGCHVTVLVFQEGDQVNLFRVVENEDGTYSPLSDSMTGTSLRNLFAEEDSEDFQRRLQENSVTMSKVNELCSKMEKLSLQRKPKKSGASVLPTKHGVNQSRHCTPGSHSLHKSPEPKNGNLKIRTHQSHFHLPPISNRSENIVPSSPTTKPSVPRNSYLEVSSLLDGAASRRREEQDVKLPKPGKSSLNFSPSYGMQEKEFDFQNLPSHGLLAPFASSSNDIEHRRVNRILSNLRVLPDVKPKIESNYGCSRESAKKVIERTNSNRELDLPDSHKLNVVAQPDMAILEEHAPAVLTEIPDISSTPRPISVQSHKETAVLMSELPSDAVASSVKNLAENHYRLIILDEENHPKTSLENLTEHQKALQTTGTAYD